MWTREKIQILLDKFNLQTSIDLIKENSEDNLYFRIIFQFTQDEDKLISINVLQLILEALNTGQSSTYIENDTVTVCFDTKITKF